MAILQIQGSTAVIPTGYNDLLTAFNGTFQFLSPDGNHATYRDLNLSLWYFYDLNLDHVLAYKNAIWIRVHHPNIPRGIRIWIFVLINEKGKKKASVFSNRQLNLAGFTQGRSEAYQLPVFDNHRVHFPANGGELGFYENYESQEVQYMEMEDLLIQVTDRLNGIKAFIQQQ